MRYGISGVHCARYQAAKEIRSLDPKGNIKVFSEHGEAPYNPMLTTYYVSGEAERSGAFPFGDLEKTQKELQLEIESQTRVKHVCGETKNYYFRKWKRRNLLTVYSLPQAQEPGRRRSRA